jgi:hypothetical protein
MVGIIYRFFLRVIQSNQAGFSRFKWPSKSGTLVTGQFWLHLVDIGQDATF